MVSVVAIMLIVYFLEQSKEIIKYFIFHPSIVNSISLFLILLKLILNVYHIIEIAIESYTKNNVIMFEINSLIAIDCEESFNMIMILVFLFFEFSWIEFLILVPYFYLNYSKLLSVILFDRNILFFIDNRVKFIKNYCILMKIFIESKKTSIYFTN
jgi:hypothetical protein